MADAERDGRDERLYEIAARARAQAVTMFEALEPDQWQVPSLCAGWTVREVLAHLVPDPPGHPVRDTVRLLGLLIRHRGDLDAMVDSATRADARRDPTELVARLREQVDARVSVPVLGAAGPACDVLIHLNDAARPLGSPACPPPEDWRAVLDFLVSKPARRGFVPAARIAGLRLVAVDPGAAADWTHGEGAPVRGTGEALALGIAGRSAVLPELSGPGVAVLAERLGPA